MEQTKKIKFDFNEREGRYTALAWHTSFNRPMASFFLSDEKPSVEAVELAVLDICETATDIQVRIIEDCAEEVKIFSKPPFPSIVKEHVKFPCEVCGRESIQMAEYKSEELASKVFSCRCDKHLVTQESLLKSTSSFVSIRNI